MAQGRGETDFSNASSSQKEKKKYRTEKNWAAATKKWLLMATNLGDEKAFFYSPSFCRREEEEEERHNGGNIFTIMTRTFCGTHAVPCPLRNRLHHARSTSACYGKASFGCMASFFNHCQSSTFFSFIAVQRQIAKSR